MNGGIKETLAYVADILSWAANAIRDFPERKKNDPGAGNS